MSALWARFPLPVIPAPGDPTPSAPSLRVLEDLPRRVRISDAHQSGFIAAAVLLSVLGSVAIALRPESLGGLGWYVVGATAAASVAARPGVGFGGLQGLAAGPALPGGGRPGGALHRDGAYPPPGWSLVLVALASAWVVVALNPGIASPETYSLPLRRLLGFVAAGLDASLIPVMAYLVGLFTWVLNR